jgi:hypothetical protein
MLRIFFAVLFGGLFAPLKAEAEAPSIHFVTNEGKGRGFAVLAFGDPSAYEVLTAIAGKSKYNLTFDEDARKLCLRTLFTGRVSDLDICDMEDYVLDYVNMKNGRRPGQVMEISKKVKNARAVRVQKPTERRK